MTAVLRVVASDPACEKMASNESCSPISCNNCGIHSLCREIDGSEADLSLPETLVKNHRMVERGELLYKTNEPVRNIYAIRTGSVKTYILASNGRMQITGFHIPGELLGLGAIAAHYFTTEAMALESTMVCEVSIKALETYSKKYPSIRQKMLKILSQEIRDNQELMLLLGKKSADERLASFLLSISQRFQRRRYSPTEFNLSMSRSDIGNYLGITEETVCRVFTRFQNEGLLAAERRQVQLLDMERLDNIACG